MPLISICIPAYKNAEYLSRLLESITKQDFKDFEVVITDDSPDDGLNELIAKYDSLNITYIKNEPALGSPTNWNFSIANAHAEWIKIMHDDDWFTEERSLSLFAEAANNSNVDFIFSGFYEENIQTKKRHENIISDREELLIRKSPYNLLKKNFIGHPSTTLIRNRQQQQWFNNNLKWVVDIEFYIRLLNSGKNFYCIKKALVTIGINPLQITKQVFRDPKVEIPENLSLLQLNPDLLKYFYAYDYYWRLLRNLSIRNLSDIERNKRKDDVVPESLKRMLSFQKKFPLIILRNGIVSKFLMTISYLFNQSKS